MKWSVHNNPIPDFLHGWKRSSLITLICLGDSYGAPVAPVQSSYDPPDSYGAPKAPVETYGAPKAPVETYGAPQAPVESYGAPQAPVESYGAPKAPVETYGAPQAPVESYGAPQAPVESYGTPQAPVRTPPTRQPITQPPDFVSPDPQYGFTPCFTCASSPRTPSATEEYGSPAASAAEDYGSPVAPVAEEYGSPAAPVADFGSPSAPAAPVADYGSLVADPLDSFAPVAEYGSPVADPLDSFAPVADYGSPVADLSSSFAPGDNYGSPVGSQVEPTEGYFSPVDFSASTEGSPLQDSYSFADFQPEVDKPAVLDKGQPGIPLPIKGVTVKLAVENNILNLPPANLIPQSQHLDRTSKSIVKTKQKLTRPSNPLPKYNNRSDFLPQYNKPSDSLPNPSGVPPNFKDPSGNQPSYAPGASDQAFYDPFVFQAENAPPPSQQRPPFSTPQQPPSSTPQRPLPPSRQGPASSTPQRSPPPSQQRPPASADQLPLPTRVPGAVNTEVELIDIPDFQAQLNANLKIKGTSRPGSPSFGFLDINNSIDDQSPEIFNPFGVSVASGFGEKLPSPRRTTPTTSTATTTTPRTTTTQGSTTTTQRSTTTRATTTTTTTRATSTTTRRTTTTTRTRRPAQSFQQQQIAPEDDSEDVGFIFNDNVNNRPLPPTFAPVINTINLPTFRPFSGPSFFSLGLSLQTTPQPQSIFSNTIDSFFGNSQQQSRLSTTTTQQTTTRTTTTRTTTKRPVLQQQSLLPSSVDEGVLQGISSINLGSNLIQPIFFSKPEKLQVAGTLDEIHGNSGIFFSTPESTFVTPDDFATPAPKHPSGSGEAERTRPRPRDPTSEGPFKANLIVTSPTPSVGRRPTPATGLVVPKISEDYEEEEQERENNSVNSIFKDTTKPFGTSPRPSGSFISFGGHIQNIGSSGRTATTPLPFGTGVSPGFIEPTNSIVPLDFAAARTLSREQAQRKQKSSEVQVTEVTTEETGGETNSTSRRNMLMNIILRPGGGDRSKALPRPQVEVSSEGANVILVRLTFPENENIHGLRAFTPTDPADLEKFNELSNSILPEARIERITGLNSEESSENDFIQTSTEGKEITSITSDPTRPTRPPKTEKLILSGKDKPFKPSQSYLPPIGAPAPVIKPSLSYLPPPGAPVPKPSTSYLPPPGATPPKSQDLTLPSLSPPAKQSSTKSSGFLFNNLPYSEEDSLEVKGYSGSRIRPRNPVDPAPKPEKPVRYFYPVVDTFQPHEAMGAASLEKYLSQEENTDFRETGAEMSRDSANEVLTSWTRPPRPKGQPGHRLQDRESRKVMESPELHRVDRHQGYIQGHPYRHPQGYHPGSHQGHQRHQQPDISRHSKYGVGYFINL